MIWTLRIDVVRNFMSSRISAEDWEMYSVEQMSMNRIWTEAMEHRNMFDKRPALY